MTTISQAVENIRRTLEEREVLKHNARQIPTKMLIVHCERLVKVYDELEEELKGFI
jgi:predicted transcriptional regulator